MMVYAGRSWSVITDCKQKTNFTTAVLLGADGASCARVVQVELCL